MTDKLTAFSEKLTSLGIPVKLGQFQIRISPELKKFNPATRKLLYSLLNGLEKEYFVLIDGLPYCLMPDANEHIVYDRKSSFLYSKKEECRRCKCSAFCPGWPESEMDDKFSPQLMPDLPKEIVLEVTQNCNQDCLLCFSSKEIKELPLAKVKEIISDCKKLGIREIRFSGGEPLLYKHLKEALSFAKESGLYVLLNTNATMVDKKNINYLKKFVDNVLVSLQGNNRESEKKLTRTNISFEKKLKNISTLARYIPIVRIGTIISHTLINEWPKYMRLIDELKVKVWELYRPMTESNNPEFDIKRSDLIKIVGFIKRGKAGDAEIKIANPVPFCISRNLALNSKVLLGANADDGHSRIVFDSSGYFKPSYSITTKLGLKIKDSWNNSFLKKIHSSSLLPSKCQKCFYLKWCKGGSRYWSKVSGGSYFGLDPWAKT